MVRSDHGALNRAVRASLFADGQGSGSQGSDSQGFRHLHVIRFQETDAAGVMYFANLLTLCHEAYEVALAAAGFDITHFFSRENAVAVPIVHTEADFYRPMHCGETVAIYPRATQLSAHSFEICYKIYAVSSQIAETDPSEPADVELADADIELADIAPAHKSQAHKRRDPRGIAKALTRHVCINSATRQRQPLTPELKRWIESLSEPTAAND
ncbi:MAG: acyl-CoA thioesterase [Phormidesmis sp.]